MAEKEKGTSEQEFQIKDRRRFTEDGERRPSPEGPSSAGAAHGASGGSSTDRSPQTAGPGEGTRKDKDQESRSTPPRDLPEVNFSTFIFSLSSSTLIHLGLVPDPATGKHTVDLPLAKQTIDILNMLKEKTRGNLTHDESKLMENLVYDLKMRYVEAVKKHPAP